MAEYSLFSKITPYLDKHLLFPLLENMTNNPNYDQKVLNDVKLRLLQSTFMVDYAIELYNNPNDVPQELLEKRRTVLEILAEAVSAAEPINQIISLPEAVALISREREYTVLYQNLKIEFNFDPTMLEHLYKVARLRFECGDYLYAANKLDAYLSLITMNHPNFKTALWGKLASDILNQFWEHALNEFKQLKETIDNKVYKNEVESLQERTWLLHWSLFIYFNHPDGKEHLIDLFLYQIPYLNIIQTVCPHLLRYLTAAVITSKRKKQALKDLIKIFKQEYYAHNDPLIEFMVSLFVDCDFEKAKKKMLECAILLESDFFLCNHKDECMEAIRQMTFEKYTKIHQCLSLSVVAEKLNMNVAEAEKWIGNLVATTRVDVKIEYSKGHVLMNTQVIPPYQKIIDKAKTLSYHTQNMASLIENRALSNIANPPMNDSSSAMVLGGATAPSSGFSKNNAYYWNNLQAV
ncbi:unnamed protein product [Gordionus sp. m RMFG-2023]|uniref:eukaryotic translation initiation factor 3 subunit E-like n=1 Tax=Gordionus sp. m RMFG-2023 TaxID=3053472 RepID=UPI0030E56D71